MDVPGDPVDGRALAQPSPVVAPFLLNKILAVADADGVRWVRLVEVEAYGETDPASHSFRGPSNRNNVMFGSPGRLYVYFSYGMHWCANVVTERSGVGAAVLLRAGEPLGGIEAMTAARNGVRLRDLCRGPARLAQAVGITGADNGAELGTPTAAGRTAWVLDDGVAPPARPAHGPRVGISRAVEVPWRWWVEGSPWVSTFRGGGPGPAGSNAVGRRSS